MHQSIVLSKYLIVKNNRHLEQLNTYKNIRD